MSISSSRIFILAKELTSSMSLDERNQALNANTRLIPERAAAIVLRINAPDTASTIAVRFGASALKRSSL
jgi:hypothetical protein